MFKNNELADSLLLDVIELLVNLPEHKQSIGTQGTIVECHDLNHFEVEFSTTDKITAIFGNLPENKREEILDFARFLYQKA